MGEKKEELVITAGRLHLAVCLCGKTGASSRYLLLILLHRRAELKTYMHVLYILDIPAGNSTRRRFVLQRIV